MATSTDAVAQGDGEKKIEQQQGGAVKLEVKLEGAALTEAIKKQVEYYFSRENLVQDAYLVSKMDKEHFVELSVIADFKLMKALTTDEKVIIEAVKTSAKITWDEASKRLRPTVANARTTLILRNIPSATPEEDLKKWLGDAKVPTIVSIRSDVGDNWFITLETEDAAKQALEIVKPLKWENKAIGCAIKSESLLKGITPGSPPKGVASAGYYVAAPYNSGGFYAYNGEGGQGGFRQGARGGARRGPGGPGQVNSNGVPVGADGADGTRRGGGKKKAGRKDNGKEGGSPIGGVDGVAAQQPPINMADFPELETKGGKSVSPREKIEGSEVKQERWGASAVSIVAKGVAKPVPSHDKDDKTAVPNGHVNGASEPKEVKGPTSSDSSSSSSSDGSNKSRSNNPGAITGDDSIKSKKMSYAQMAQMNGTAPPPEGKATTA